MNRTLTECQLLDMLNDDDLSSDEEDILPSWLSSWHMVDHQLDQQLVTVH